MKTLTREAHVRAIIALAVLALYSPLAEAARATTRSADEGSTEFQAVMERTYGVEEPGAAAIVVRGDEVLYRGARGMADLELGIPLEPDMVFRLGSITKQFTGVAIRLLELEGQLKLDDPLTKFLPDYPQGEEPVTVEQLLAHTSGIKSYTGIPGYMDQEIRKDLEVEELVDVFDDLPADFEPGERYRYNNSGYVLLGAIIEAVTDMTYEEFLQERIFAPLGMQSSLYDDPERIVPRRAKGYQKTPSGWRNAPFLSMTQPYSAGSLASTVDDLTKWNRALHSGKLMKPEQAEVLWRSFRTDDGEEVDYGYGFGFGEVRGHEMIQHGGGIHGFRTYALTVPSEDLYVAVLSNFTGPTGGPAAVAMELAAIALGDPFPVREAISLSEDVLKGHVGVYRINDEESRTISLADGKLYSQRTGGARLELLPESETRFFYDGSFTYVDFVRDENGETTHMVLYPDGSKEGERAERTEQEVESRAKVEISAADAAELSGEYEIAPTFVITIRADGQDLYTQATGQPEFELFSSGKDEYFLEVVDAQLSVQRDDTGAITGVVLHQGGRDVPAKRKN